MADKVTEDDDTGGEEAAGTSVEADARDSDETADRGPDTPLGGGDALTSCPRCSMRVRRSELEIHLAHAHNWAQGKKPQRRQRRD